MPEQVTIHPVLMRGILNAYTCNRVEQTNKKVVDLLLGSKDSGPREIMISSDSSYERLIIHRLAEFYTVTSKPVAKGSPSIIISIPETFDTSSPEFIRKLVELGRMLESAKRSLAAANTLGAEKNKSANRAMIDGTMASTRRAGKGQATSPQAKGSAKPPTGSSPPRLDLSAQQALLLQNVQRTSALSAAALNQWPQGLGSMIGQMVDSMSAGGPYNMQGGDFMQAGALQMGQVGPSGLGPYGPLPPASGMMNPGFPNPGISPYQTNFQATYNALMAQQALGLMNMNAGLPVQGGYMGGHGHGNPHGQPMPGMASHVPGMLSMSDFASLLGALQVGEKDFRGHQGLNTNRAGSPN